MCRAVRVLRALGYWCEIGDVYRCKREIECGKRDSHSAESRFLSGKTDSRSVESPSVVRKRDSCVSWSSIPSGISICDRDDLQFEVGKREERLCESRIPRSKRHSHDVESRFP